MYDELPIIQKTYDFTLWFVPILNRLPRDHKFMLGNRMIQGIYEVLELLMLAQYAQAKVGLLQAANPKIGVLRYQTRLLLDFQLMNERRYEYAVKQLNSIGTDLGSWIKQRKKKEGGLAYEARQLSVAGGD